MTLLVCVGCYAKPNCKKVTTEYLYHLPDNVSRDQALEIAIQRAKAQAIADEFGSIVTQSTSIHIETSDLETTTDFLSIGGSELKGEWIETTGDPIIEYITNGVDIAIKVKISGVIREIEGAKIPFESRILRNGVSDNHESDQFNSGDDLYLSFISPASGYLAIYLIDAQRDVYCLLPYQDQEDGIFKIKANHRYVFFHPDHAEGIDKKQVDEITTETTETKERDRLLIVFSPKPFYKAADNKTQTDLPRNLSYDNFQKWLANVKKKDVELSAFEKSFVIIGK